MVDDVKPNVSFAAARAFLADGLTVFRFVAVGVIVWLGAWQGASSLPVAVLVLTVAWTADWLDGPLARSAGRPTRLGPYDFSIDVALTWATFLYLGLCGFVPAAAVLVYTGLALAAFLWLRRRVVLMLFMRGIDVIAAVTVLRIAPILLLPFAVMLALFGIARRKRVQNRLALAVTELAALVRGCNESAS